ncbi:MAG: hypothetical protein HKP48_05655 [Winogradskyella sp.]|uniref:hypothetical protein n=1 Tax=Winogradskyella sp. TaxID=1883156 RepID=UPI0017FAF44A|nr:hypothetical protein [Winogradskyella sp.]MBT8245440.1 hypothetical protein [Winogradskyella sp.]NNK22783.1 hypothetical protein [Winogradskyella sp.]
MSKNLKHTPQNEEVDLGQLFKMIGNLFQRFFNFIKSIFTAIGLIFVYFLKDIFSNIKIISIVAIVALVLGYVLDKRKDKVYFAEMFVKPYFDSKYELINNVDYYNSLIKLEDLEELSSQFNVTQAEAESILSFDIEIGPESKNEQIQDFDAFLKPLDSVTKGKIEFEDYIEDRNIYNAGIYLLKARSKDYKIFKKLEEGLKTSLQNKYSEIKKRKRDSVLLLEEENLKSSLLETQKLKATYLDVLQKEADKNNISTRFENTFGLQIEKTDTKEDVLLNQELKILNQLSDIRKELVTDDQLFDIIAAFKEKGLLENIWYKKFKIILPLLGLLLLGLFFNGLKFYKYIMRYQK